MHQKTLVELSADLQKGSCSSEELTRACLERISKYDSELNSFVTVVEQQALAAAMSRLLEDGELRAELSRRSRARAAEFTWEKCAAQTMEVYRTVAGLAVAAGGPDN